jgi:hypothetical protein
VNNNYCVDSFSDFPQQKFSIFKDVSIMIKLSTFLSTTFPSRVTVKLPSSPMIQRSIRHYDLPGLVMRMESGLAEIERHFSSWKIKLNSAKTESILLNHSKIMRDKMISNKITFNNSVLEWLPVVKYLDVLLDSKLLMKQNIENNVVKARKATGAVNQHKNAIAVNLWYQTITFYN